MKVSVVIPNYNHAKFLPQRIETVLAQTYENFDVLILDDASPDDSRTVIAKYVGGRVRFVGNDRNSGSTFVQWQRGFQLTQGEFVWIAESDDEAHPQFLARMVAALEAMPAAGFAYCQAALIDSDGREFGLARPVVDASGNPTPCAKDCSWTGIEELEHSLRGMVSPVPNASSVLFRRRAVEAAGGVDTSFRLCGDLDLYGRLLLNGPVAYLAAPLNRYRHHLGTVRARTDRDGMGLAEQYRLVHVFRERLGRDWPEKERCLRHLARGWAAASMRGNGRLSRQMHRQIWREACRADAKLAPRLVGAFWSHFVFGFRRRVGLPPPPID